MNTKDENTFGGLPAPGEQEMELYDKFILEYARAKSTDGGKTAKINGGIIVIDQPHAQPKKKNP